jgi:hypothetical protein
MNQAAKLLAAVSLSGLMVMAPLVHGEWISPQANRIEREIALLEGELQRCEGRLAERRLTDAGQNPELLRLKQRDRTARKAYQDAYLRRKQAEQELTEANIIVYHLWGFYSRADGSDPPPPILRELFGPQILSATNPYEKSMRAAMRRQDELEKKAEAAREALSQADAEVRSAEVALNRYQSRLDGERQALSTDKMEIQCANLQQKLAAQQTTLLRARRPSGTAAISASQLLSGSEALTWLKDNGYLNPDGTPAANLRDWQDQTHSSLGRGNHPLRGIAGDLSTWPDGRIRNAITISVERPSQGLPSTASPAANGWNLDNASSWSGSAGDAAPDGVMLLDQPAPASTTTSNVNRPSRTSLPQGYAPTREEWLAMDEADQRYYYEAARARSRAEHEAEMAAMRQGMAADAETHRRTTLANEQRLREGRLQLENARADAAREAAMADRYNEAALASSRRAMEENRRLLRQTQPEIQGPPARQAVTGAASQPVQADTPVHEPARSALLQAIRERHQRWHATWCPRVVSGCSIVPDGARDELLQWTRNATQQRKIERIRLLLDCYDSCVMANPKSERQVGQCRNDCKSRIP